MKNRDGCALSYLSRDVRVSRASLMIARTGRGYFIFSIAVGAAIIPAFGS